MATATLARSRSRLNCQWIVGPGVDLSLVIGSCLAGYLYLLLNLVLQVPISFLWWFWSVGFDGTHIFGTASRTFFDREARQNQRLLLFGSALLFFSIGPFMILLGQKGLLALIVGIWAYDHVIRQHYGFMVLYKVKNGDLDQSDKVLDRCFLAVMLVFPPFHRFFVHHPEELGISRGVALELRLPVVEPVMWLLAGTMLAAYVAAQILRARAGRPVNIPKLLLLGGVVPLHWLTFAYMSWQAAVPTITIVHNLQYHALVWFHNRNKYTVEGGAVRFGRIPRAVGTSLAGYVLFAMLFSLLYRVPGFHLGKVSDLAFGFFCGFGLTHYYLDSKIWRVRTDPSLRQTLRLA